MHPGFTGRILPSPYTFIMDKFERKVAGDENVDQAIQDQTLS